MMWVSNHDSRWWRSDVGCEISEGLPVDGDVSRGNVGVGGFSYVIPCLFEGADRITLV